jgi:hypothetical protein
MAAHGVPAPEIAAIDRSQPERHADLLCRARARVRAAVLAAHPA